MTQTEHIRLPERALRVFSHEQILAALDELAAGLNARYEGASVTVLCVMNGGLMLTGHLMPRLDFDVRLAYCHATRYDDTTTGRELRWIAEPSTPVAGKRILILDDILDEGRTLGAIIDYCVDDGAREVVSAVLLDKQHARKSRGISADHTALVCADRYVFGFGMDYEGAYRHLGAIYALGDDPGEQQCG